MEEVGEWAGEGEGGRSLEGWGWYSRQRVRQVKQSVTIAVRG
jgi:hypothetical protein